MKECIIDNNITIPSDNQSAIIGQPRKSPLNLIATFVTSHLAAIIIFLLFVHTSVWANQLDSPPFQPLAKSIAVVSLVGNQAFGIFLGSSPAFTRHSDIIQCLFEQLDFRWGRTVQVVSQRNALAVDHHHPLRALASFGWTDAFALFCGSKAAVDKCLRPVQLSSLVEFSQKCPPSINPDILFLPQFQPAPTG